MVELQGPSGAGRTQLLLFFALTALLPARIELELDGRTQSFELGGKERNVVWFDCLGSFDIRRLATLLHCHLSTALPASAAPLVPSLVRRCLSQFHLFRPSTSLSLAATLSTLSHPPHYLILSHLT